MVVSLFDYSDFHSLFMSVFGFLFLFIYFIVRPCLKLFLNIVVKKFLISTTRRDKNICLHWKWWCYSNNRNYLLVDERDRNKKFVFGWTKKKSWTQLEFQTKMKEKIVIRTIESKWIHEHKKKPRQNNKLEKKNQEEGIENKNHIG